jgi:hypothetical protein
MATPTTPSSLLASNLGGGAVGGLGGGFSGSVVGYIDSAIPQTQFRLRYDSAYHDSRPDRAEFFYAKCGCQRVGTPPPDPHAAGPVGIETRVDYQDITAYGELALDNKFSVFVEAPFRFLNPEVNANTAGFADMNAGFKYAVIADPCQYLTFAFRTWIPTGDSFHGLGTNHVSLEPELLYYKRMDKLAVEAELRDWIPIDGSDLAGNILRYGVGVGYEIYRNCSNNLSIWPILEVVGWSILSGKELEVFPTIVSPTNPLMAHGSAFHNSAGEEIVNIKVGTRVFFGEGSSLYVGWGHALTGTFWYKDIIRAEYRLTF